MIPSADGQVCTLDELNPNSLMKIYCACGRIMGLDRSEMKVKISLGKEVQCVYCRNARISREIDFLNENSEEASESDPLYSF